MFVLKFQRVIVVLVFLSENDSEKPLFSHFEIEGQFKIVEFLVFQILDRGSAFSTWVQKVIPTCDVSKLGYSLFMREDVFFRKLPLGGPIFSDRTIHSCIGALPIQLITFFVGLISL